jgi:ATP-dependent DNA helicase RecG
MERRGSGLHKIIAEYPSETAPLFRSTEQSFIVTLKNLNFSELSSPNGEEIGVDNGDDNIEKILNVIKVEPSINQKNLAVKTGLSPRTISREIKAMRENGTIRRVGSDRSGYWEIV